MTPSEAKKTSCELLSSGRLFILYKRNRRHQICHGTLIIYYKPTPDNHVSSFYQSENLIVRSSSYDMDLHNKKLNEKTAYISIIIGLIGGFLLFPAPDFSKSLLVGVILPTFTTVPRHKMGDHI